MGCGFKINNYDLIVKLLTNDFQDFSFSKENELCSWTLELNVNNPSNLSSRLVNIKNNSKPNAINSRSIFGYKTNNKVNNYIFRHYKSNENYMIQYRNENKSHRCLPYNIDVSNTTFMPTSSNDSFEVPVSNVPSQKVSSDPIEKPLIHQVRFWQNQNLISQPIGDSSQVVDVLKPNNVFQINTIYKSNNPNTFAQRSNFNTKRNLDMVVPQGTAYDILSDESQLNHKEDSDKLNIKVSEPGSGLVTIPYSYLRESSRAKRFHNEGGSLEFAKLLDEKLRQLYEQKNLFHPIIELNRGKPEIRCTKSVSRLKSANPIKEKSSQVIHSNSLNALSINGQSAGSRFMNPSQKMPSSSESQCTCCIPCLLPQMPAFGMHNFPKFIVYKCTNSNCPMKQHDE